MSNRYPNFASFSENMVFVILANGANSFILKKKIIWKDIKEKTKISMKKLANIDIELKILHQHEEEIVTIRLFDDKIGKLENIIADKDKSALEI